MKIVLLILLSYLLGSIPFSHIFPRLKGKDVCAEGTKNVGATNALAVAGPLMGILACIGDMGKGFLAVYLAQRFYLPVWAVCSCGFAAIIGHDFSVFLRFKGGKGIATTGGTVFAIDPIFTLFALLIYVLLVIVTRYFILSTLIVLGSVPVMMWVLGWRVEYIIYMIAAFLLALYTHRGDIQRLLVGQEKTIQETFQTYRKK
jgi:glycerol-3-phosphate acyltransferase PlsY